MARDPARPACPVCGYDIFGVREMRCPECGRELSITDFNPDYAPRTGDSRRYERDGAVGGLAGVIVLMLLLLPMLWVAGQFARYRVMPGAVMLAIGGLVVWLGIAVVFTGVALGMVQERAAVGLVAGPWPGAAAARLGRCAGDRSRGYWRCWWRPWSPGMHRPRPSCPRRAPSA
jgi:hypothetical protein